MNLDQNRSSSLFPRTDWSGLVQAAARHPDQLDQLVQRYQRPMRVFLLSEFPSLRDHADDLLQQFAADKILQQGWLARADPARGKFRDLLKASLRNYARDFLRKQGNAPVSIEDVATELPTPQATEAFDLAWAREVISETLRRMEADCLTPRKNQPNRHRIWQVFRFRLLDPILQEAPPAGYKQAIVECGIESPAEAHNLLATAKRMFERHLRGVIAEYEAAGPAALAELEDLKALLNRLSCPLTRTASQDSAFPSV